MFKRLPTVKWSELDKKALIIDVREKDEFKAYNVKGTKNVPLSKIDNYSTSETVYVTCASGARSKMAVKKLRAKGIDAINISGGVMAYE